MSYYFLMKIESDTLTYNFSFRDTYCILEGFAHNMVDKSFRVVFSYILKRYCLWSLAPFPNYVFECMHFHFYTLVCLQPFFLPINNTTSLLSPLLCHCQYFSHHYITYHFYYLFSLSIALVVNCHRFHDHWHCHNGHWISLFFPTIFVPIF